MAAWFRKPKFTTLVKPAQRGRIPEGLWIKCPACMETIVRRDWEEASKVCPRCGYHARLTAPERIETLLDADSFEEFDAELASADPLGFIDTKPYADRLEQARQNTGLNEAVVCGLGRVQARPISIAVMDTHFIGGSMGSVVGEKIARAIERGLKQGLPVVVVCASGGARMQEGALSLMQMAKTCALIARLREARLPLITILTDPTTGGVTASFATLGDVVLAEPNALIGFAGPRVIEQTIKQILPRGFQRAEFVAEHGFVDIVCRRGELQSTVGNLLALLLHARPKAGKATARREEIEAAVSSSPASK
jgi:acetyl-CoA carboxylase carboxyl transferase subunit beta